MQKTTSTHFFLLGFATTIVAALWISLFSPVLSGSYNRISPPPLVIHHRSNQLLQNVRVITRELQQSSYLALSTVGYQFTAAWEAFCGQESACIPATTSFILQEESIFARTAVLAQEIDKEKRQLISSTLLSFHGLSRHVGLYASSAVLGVATQEQAWSVQEEASGMACYVDTITFGLVHATDPKFVCR